MPDCPARHIPKSSIMNITNRCFDHSLRFADLLPQNMIHTYRYRKPDACQQPRKPASQPGQETASPVLVFTSGIRAFLFFLCIPARLHHPCLFQVQPVPRPHRTTLFFPFRPCQHCSLRNFQHFPQQFSLFFLNFLYWILYLCLLIFYLYVFRIFLPIFSIIYCSF